MKNRFSVEEAAQYSRHTAGCPATLAMLVHTSRLIGQEGALVLHGGGNTSAKATVTNLMGEPMEVLFIKGSGWDLATIEPAGFPALDLDYLRSLRVLARLGDEEMVNQFRTHLLDASSPDPSIETLAHAFLPHRFIYHTHADAIVTLTNLADGEARLREALGGKIATLPFIMPGFPLAKAMAELYERQPEVEAIILMHHGIFTFGDDAQSAYGRMIDYVSRAEDFLAAAGEKAKPVAAQDVAVPGPEVVLPLLRGAVSPAGQPMVLHLRQSPELLAALARPDAEAFFTTGVLTPDHVIRTKNYPLFLNLGGTPSEAAMARQIAEKVAAYAAAYDAYFTEQITAKGVDRVKLDPLPRVLLVPGLGIIGAGGSAKAARIAADIAEHTVMAKVVGAAVGPYRELSAGSIFDMEYWSLEQAKLGKGKSLPLSGRVAVVTGGGGAIALGIGRKLLEAGARVFLSDIDTQRLQAVCDKLAVRFGTAMVSPLVMDVTDASSVAAALATVVRENGGFDILVPNAGIAHVARLESLDTAKFQQVLAVNCLGVFEVIKAGVPIFRRQGMGGQVIINSSKNVFDPGPAFGAYSASKAGAHQLGKIAALELAEIGVRVNMINADAIFDADGVPSGLWDVVGPDRMRARNLDPEGLKEYYRNRNLLKTEVLADHVGNAVVFFASGLTPTTGATLPVDGGIPAAFPR